MFDFDAEVEDLRYSHDKIYDHFGDQRSVYELVVQLLLGEVNLRDLQTLQVVKQQRRLFSLNNRRLYALKMFKQVLKRFGYEDPLNVKVRVVEPTSGYAFTTENQGTKVEVSRPSCIKFEMHARGPVAFTSELRRSLSARHWSVDSHQGTDGSLTAQTAPGGDGSEHGRTAQRSRGPKSRQPSSHECLDQEARCSVISGWEVEGCAIEDFNGIEFGSEYLNFSKGNSLYKMSCPPGVESSGWAYGRVKGGKEGWFPPCYWKAISSPGDVPPPSPAIPRRATIDTQPEFFCVPAMEATCSGDTDEFFDEGKHEDGAPWHKVNASSNRRGRSRDSSAPHFAKNAVIHRGAAESRTHPCGVAPRFVVKHAPLTRPCASSASGSSHRELVQELEHLDDEAASYVVQSMVSNRSNGVSVTSRPLAGLRRSASQPVIAPISLVRARGRAELEVGDLLIRWLRAYLAPRHGSDRKINSTVRDLLAKVVPEISFGARTVSADAAAAAVISWMRGSGTSLGPHNQVEILLNKLRFEVDRVEILMANRGL